MSKLVKKIFKDAKHRLDKTKHFVKKHWKKIAIAALVVFTAGAAAVVAAGGTWGGAIASVGSTFSAGASALTGGVIGTSAVTAAGSTASATALAAGATAAEAAAAGVAATSTAAASTAAATGVSGAISGAATSVGNVVGGGLKAVGIQGNAAVNGVNAAGNAATQAATQNASREAAKQALIKSGQAVTEKAITQTIAQGGMSMGKAMLVGTGVQAAGALYQGYEQKKAEEQAKEEQENASYYGMNGKGQYVPGFGPSTPTAYASPAYQSGASRAYTPNRPTLLNRAAYQLPKV
jgi:hypothetical protein